MRVGRSTRIILLAILSLLSFFIYIEKDIFILKFLLWISIIFIAHTLCLGRKGVEKCKDSNIAYRSAMESIDGYIWQWNDFTKDIYISDKLKYVLGFNDNIISLEQWYEVVSKEDFYRVSEYFNTICGSKISLETKIEYKIKDINDNEMCIRYVGKGKLSEGIQYLVGTIIDITEENINKEIELNPRSFYDDITGAPSRKYFSKELEVLMRNSIINKSNIALIFIDIDNFKSINDTYGYDLGDSILVEISKMFSKTLDSRYKFARLCADEFIIAVPNIKKISQTDEILKKILESMKNLIDINGNIVHFSYSVGVSVYPADASSVELLIKTANMAMRKAKANGKNRYEFFDDNLMKKMQRENKLEKALREALNNKEIYMMFQPQISLNSGEIYGFEALVRWNSSELGFISPAEFIPVAEKTGMIVDLGKYIIEESIKSCKELSLLTSDKFNIAINISEVQLSDDRFITFISEVLEKYELNPSYVEFEITESLIMKSVTKNIEKLSKLKELGVTVALDDFGTGYSSLNYLRRLPIDVVKVDKSFVDGIGVDEKSECIAESIIELSHNLDLVVVAEGVETGEQLGYLNKMNCDIIQGYYFSKPEKFNIIKEMILN